jgi:hypothetical protein
MNGIVGFVIDASPKPHRIDEHRSSEHFTSGKVAPHTAATPRRANSQV